MKIQIKSISGGVIYETKAKSVKEAIEKAISWGVSLEGEFPENDGANLREADLRKADLKGGNFRYADFTGADLREADLREAEFYGANFNSIFFRTKVTKKQKEEILKYRCNKGIILSKGKKPLFKVYEEVRS